jgi:hypothetical protein
MSGSISFHTLVSIMLTWQHSRQHLAISRGIDNILEVGLAMSKARHSSMNWLSHWSFRSPNHIRSRETQISSFRLPDVIKRSDLCGAKHPTSTSTLNYPSHTHFIYHQLMSRFTFWKGFADAVTGVILLTKPEIIYHSFVAKGLHRISGLRVPSPYPESADGRSAQHAVAIMVSLV